MRLICTNPTRLPLAEFLRHGSSKSCPSPSLTHTAAELWGGWGAAAHQMLTTVPAFTAAPLHTAVSGFGPGVPRAGPGPAFQPVDAGIPPPAIPLISFPASKHQWNFWICWSWCLPLSSLFADVFSSIIVSCSAIALNVRTRVSVSLGVCRPVLPKPPIKDPKGTHAHSTLSRTVIFNLFHLVAHRN